MCYGLPRWLSGKEPACQCRRLGCDPWVGKIPWRKKWQSTPVLQYSCLENPTDRGVWWATVHRVTRSRIQLSMHTHICSTSVLTSFFFFFLATPFGRWDLGSLTRHQTRGPCSESMESKPLDHQGSLSIGYYYCHC